MSSLHLVLLKSSEVSAVGRTAASSTRSVLPKIIRVQCANTDPAAEIVAVVDAAHEYYDEGVR